MGTRGTGALLGPGLKSLVLVMLSVLVATEASAKSNDKSDDEERLRQRVDDALELYWRGFSGFDLPHEDLLSLAEANDQPPPPDGPKGAATYGEITATGARVVARAMGLDAPGGRDIVFMDLGSGVGKLVVQFWLEFPRLARSTGIEWSKARWDKAKKAWEAWPDGLAEELRRAAEAALNATQSDALKKKVQNHPKYKPGVYLWRDNMLARLSQHATHMYVSSTCFGQKMLGRLATRLAADAKSLQVIATLKPFPHGLDGFEMTNSVEAQMSWTVIRGGTNTVHIYQRAGSTTGPGASEL